MNDVIHLSASTHQDGTASGLGSLALAREAQSKDLVIGVVGAAGSGTSWAAEIMKRLLRRGGINSQIIKARSVLQAANPTGWAAAAQKSGMERAEAFQKIGDGLRRNNDNAFVAAGLISEIAKQRTSASAAEPLIVICDSLRHPDEAKLLRSVYGEAFWLLGVVCDEATRRKRLLKKHGLEDHGVEADSLDLFMKRDEDSGEPHGQKVAATFELGDFFIDSSPPIRNHEVPDTELDEWPVTSSLGRFLDLIRGARPLLRPTDGEQAMYQAYAARLGSACLSRQVGAALIDRKGQLLATGCNEVPRAGGGLYGQGDDDAEERERGRCHVLNGYCSNTRERESIIDDLLDVLGEQGMQIPSEEEKLTGLRRSLRHSRVGQLIEFSRSVHAEMDALISAARKGVSTVGSRLYVTTFPCHNCARHIVAAGVDEVHFIEPYLKSKALSLHSDSITLPRADWVPPSTTREGAGRRQKRVKFSPYIGAAPRLFRRAFVKDGEVKDDKTGDVLHQPKPGMLNRRPLADGYRSVEEKIAGEFERRAGHPTEGAASAGTVPRSAGDGNAT